VNLCEKSQWKRRSSKKWLLANRFLVGSQLQLDVFVRREMIERVVPKAVKARWGQRRGVTVLIMGQKAKLVTMRGPRR